MKTMYEIFTEIDIAPEFLKEETLRKHGNNTQFKKMLSIIFDPRIEWDLPEGMPPHKRDETIPPDYAYTTLGRELKGMYVFFKPSPMKNNLKREMRYIELLEALHYTEADLITWIKDGKFCDKFQTITHDLIFKVFPDIFIAMGIFATGEYVMVEGKTRAGSDFKKIVKKSDFAENPSEYFGGYTWVRDIISGEFYKEQTRSRNPEAELIRAPIVEEVVEVVTETVNESPAQNLEEIQPKKRMGRPKKVKT